MSELLSREQVVDALNAMATGEWSGKQLDALLAHDAALRAQLAAIKDTVGEENWSLRQRVATLHEEVTKLEKMLYPGGV